MAQSPPKILSTDITINTKIQCGESSGTISINIENIKTISDFCIKTELPKILDSMIKNIRADEITQEPILEADTPAENSPLILGSNSESNSESNPEFNPESPPKSSKKWNHNDLDLIKSDRSLIQSYADFSPVLCSDRVNNFSEFFRVIIGYNQADRETAIEYISNHCIITTDHECTMFIHNCLQILSSCNFKRFVPAVINNNEVLKSFVANGLNE